MIIKLEVGEKLIVEAPQGEYIIEGVSSTYPFDGVKQPSKQDSNSKLKQMYEKIRELRTNSYENRDLSPDKNSYGRVLQEGAISAYDTVLELFGGES